MKNTLYDPCQPALGKGLSHLVYIFGHSDLPTSTPLDTFKAEKSTQPGKGAIQGNHRHLQNAAAASRAEATSERKQRGNSTARPGKRAAKTTATATATTQKASVRPVRAGSTTYPMTGNAPAAPPVTKLYPTSPGNGKSWRGGRHRPKSTFRSPGPATSTDPTLRVPPRTLVPPLRPHLRAPAVLEDGRGPCFGLASRQFEAALSGAAVTKVGNWWERAIEKEKESLRRVGPSARRGWVGVGRRRTTHRRGARLLQERSLASYVLLQSSSTRQRTLRQALHGKHR